MEKEFAPGDKRRLEITNGGKLRWKNADGSEAVGSQPEKNIKINFAPEPAEYRIQKFINPITDETTFTLLGRNPRTNRWDIQYADQEPNYFRELMKVNHIIDLDNIEPEVFEFSPKEKKFVKRTEGIRAIKNGKLSQLPAEDRTQNPKDFDHSSGVNPKFKGKPFKVPTFGVAMNPDFTLDDSLIKFLREKVEGMKDNLEFHAFWVNNFIAKEGNRDTAQEVGKLLGIKGKADIDQIYLKLKGESDSVEEQPLWKYEEYNDWARRLAQTSTKEGIESRLTQLNGKKGKLAQSHLNAINKTSSMQSNSQRRAQTGNSVRANYEERNALENALEIYKYYPEKTKEGLQKPKKEITAPSYRPLQEGEESMVERKYKAYKELKFFAAHEQIESPNDVAFLFNQLQDEAVEHGFIAHETKEHGIIVQHISTGTFDSSMFDERQLWDAIDRFGTVKIHMVHNHPSGNLKPSSNDIAVWEKIKYGLPNNVEMMPGVIIDARGGGYSSFDPHGNQNGEGNLTKETDTTDLKQIKALRFSRQIFKDKATLPKSKITQPEDIIKFVYQGRFTEGVKAQILSLNTQHLVVGRFYIKSQLDHPKEVADEISVLVARSGGLKAILSTNNDFETNFNEKLNSISQQLKLKNIDLLDCISLKGDEKNSNWKSAVHERIFENSPEYKKSMFNTLLKAFGKQISLFGNSSSEAYSKEGQTKEGKGGTLTLTRDKTGKGAHWRIMNKRETINEAGKSEGAGGHKGKIITPGQAYELLQDKLGNKTFVTDNQGNLIGEGIFQLINENSEGNYSLFVSEKNGYDSVISVPKNQAAMVMEGGVQFKFADKNITVSTKEKSKDSTKPIEIEKAEENAKRSRELEKMRKYNRWNEKAEDYAELARGQKNWFFNDLEDVANLFNMEFSHNNKIIKKLDTLFKEIKRNVEKHGKEEVHSALIGAFEVGNTYKMKRIINELKDKGYEIDAPGMTFQELNERLKDKEEFFTRLKISKGENDPCPKELQFATPNLAKAAEDCAKKPNALRETETSLLLKVDAEKIPEHDTIKKKLFSQAGEGLGQLWITGGLPGSGKSSVLSAGFHKNKIIIDPDAIKFMIAEERGISKEDVNKRPWELHEDSSTLAKHLTREAVREGKDVVYDVTMKGTDNLVDILELVKNDTFQANAKFIHIPIEKGIERDKIRGERGGRSIGPELYKKLFGDYPTHKAFFQLKDDFDNFDVYDNSAPLGEGAKLFFQKNEGREQIHEPNIYNEFQKIGRTKVEKSMPLTNGVENDEYIENDVISNSDKIKMFLGFKEDRELDPEQDFFELGILKLHGLIDDNMQLTPEGEQKFEEKFGSKFSPENAESETDFNSILKPKKNIANGKENEL
jgi:DNA repair protein RadC/predicted ABC-type ATPase